MPATPVQVREVILRWARESLSRAPTARAVLLVHVEAVEYALTQLPDKKDRTETLFEICTLGEARLREIGGGS